jgi:hypothetical protein
MRISIGQPQPSRTFDPVAAGWTPLTTCGSIRYVWIALALGLPFMFGAVAIVLWFAHDWRTLFDTHPWGLPVFLAALLLLVPVHEFIHALAYRCGLRSPHLILGLWPQRGIAYVLYDFPLPRRRVLFMLAAPFMVLSVLFLGLLVVLPTGLASMAAYFFLTHTSVSGGDALTFFRLWRRVPPEALIHNQGSTTYWSANPALGSLQAAPG